MLNLKNLYEGINVSNSYEDKINTNLNNEVKLDLNKYKLKIDTSISANIRPNKLGLNIPKSYKKNNIYAINNKNKMPNIYGLSEKETMLYYKNLTLEEDDNNNFSNKVDNCDSENYESCCIACPEKHGKFYEMAGFLNKIKLNRDKGKKFNLNLLSQEVLKKNYVQYKDPVIKNSFLYDVNKKKIKNTDHTLFPIIINNVDFGESLDKQFNCRCANTLNLTSCNDHISRNLDLAMFINKLKLNKFDLKTVQYDKLNKRIIINKDQPNLATELAPIYTDIEYNKKRIEFLKNPKKYKKYSILKVFKATAHMAIFYIILLGISSFHNNKYKKSIAISSQDQIEDLKISLINWINEIQEPLFKELILLISNKKNKYSISKNIYIPSKQCSLNNSNTLRFNNGTHQNHLEEIFKRIKHLLELIIDNFKKTISTSKDLNDKKLINSFDFNLPIDVIYNLKKLLIEGSIYPCNLLTNYEINKLDFYFYGGVKGLNKVGHRFKKLFYSFYIKELVIIKDCFDVEKDKHITNNISNNKDNQKDEICKIPYYHRPETEFLENDITAIIHKLFNFNNFYHYEIINKTTDIHLLDNEILNSLVKSIDNVALKEEDSNIALILYDNYLRIVDLKLNELKNDNEISLTNPILLLNNLDLIKLNIIENNQTINIDKINICSDANLDVQLKTKILQSVSFTDMKVNKTYIIKSEEINNNNSIDNDINYQEDSYLDYADNIQEKFEENYKKTYVDTIPTNNNNLTSNDNLNLESNNDLDLCSMIFSSIVIKRMFIIEILFHLDLYIKDLMFSLDYLEYKFDIKFLGSILYYLVEEAFDEIIKNKTNDSLKYSIENYVNLYSFSNELVNLDNNFINYNYKLFVNNRKYNSFKYRNKLINTTNINSSNHFKIDSNYNKFKNYLIDKNQLAKFYSNNYEFCFNFKKSIIEWSRNLTSFIVNYNYQ